MNIEEVRKIENELQIKLPEVYKRYVLNNPYADKTKFNFVLKHFYDDPDDLIKINKRLRKNGLQKKEWLSNLFAIAYYDGEYAFIKIDDETEQIYIINRGAYKYDPPTLRKNIYDKTYERYLSVPLFLQQIPTEPPEIEEEIDINEYFKIWDEMIKKNSIYCNET